MNDADTRRLESFLRAQEFGRLQSARIPTASFAAELLARLSRIIADLETQAAAQSSGLRAAQESAASKASARDELSLDLRAIARTSRGMAVIMPGVAERFRIPPDLKDQDLLSFARSVHTDATPLAAEFIRRGLPADFLSDLDADITLFEQSITRQIQGTETHVAATAAIEELMDEGIKTMQELDPVMRNLFADNAATLAQWLSARHVERAPRRTTTTPPPPPNP